MVLCPVLLSHFSNEESKPLAEHCNITTLKQIFWDLFRSETQVPSIPLCLKCCQCPFVEVAVLRGRTWTPTAQQQSH